MRLSFIFPMALWLLLLLLPLWALSLAARLRRRPEGAWMSLLLRTALVVALVLALAGTQIVRSVDALTTVFLVDRSDSITPAARAQAEAFVRAALRSMRSDDHAAIVVFGENALVERTPSDQGPFAHLNAVPVASRTNLQAAVELGLELFPAETNKRMVVLSDGGENDGDARSAARLAQARGVPIGYVDLGRPTRGEAVLSALSAPASARQGQQFELIATVESTQAQTAWLRILGSDGKPVLGRSVQLKPGLNRFSVKVGALGQGFQRYRADVFPQLDGHPQNNQAEALVNVGGLPRVLLVEGQPGEGRNLKDALTAARINAEAIAPSALPSDLTHLGTYDAVMLINVPVNALPPAAAANLPAYVRDLGKGLVMIGGDHSFGVGGYSHTPIEAALPVAMDTRNQQERPNVAVVFVLDKSSSMNACHCNGPNREKDGYFDHSGPTWIDVGKQAVIQAVAALGPRDIAGVVTFDGSAYWAFPPQQGALPIDVQSAIAPIAPKGETNVYAGLQAAESALKQIDARIKHVVLLTDGWGHGGDPLAVAQQMHDQGITLSVVTVGKGSAPYLPQLANVGGGHFFAVQSQAEVPQIFLQESIATAQNYLVEKPFTPKYAVDSPILKGLENGVPPLYGYNATTAKATATTVLLGLDDAPVLAQWQYGLGRAVAWTSDVKGAWAKDWVSWSQFPHFAAQLVGWVLPTVAETGLAAELHTDGSRTTITVTAHDARSQPRANLSLRATLVGAAGYKQELALNQVAPGTYQANIASPPQGTYLARIAGASGDQAVTQQTIGLVVPYSPEYQLEQRNPALLADLSQISGGQRLAQPSEAFAHTLAGASNAQDIALLLLLLALVLLPIDIGVRRLLAYRHHAVA